MTQDEIAKLIPYNVKEAAAKASYNHWRNLRRCRVPSWEELPDDVRAREINEVTISLAAGLVAWGGMVCDVWKEDPEFPGQIILPLQGPAP